jgi:hypothetical protein
MDPQMLLGLPLGRRLGMTNLAYHAPTDSRLTYWTRPEDLRRLVLDYATMGEKYVYGESLSRLLNKFKIIRGGCEDEEYQPTMGTFMTQEEVYTRSIGYTVNYVTPLDRMGVHEEEDLVINGALLSVCYKHRLTPRLSYTAYYSLFTLGGSHVSVCFGWL